MSGIGKPERVTQDRVIALFKNELGYNYLGDWTDRTGNSNIEDGLLTAFLRESGNTPAQISRTLDALHREADNHNRNLHQYPASKGRHRSQFQIRLPVSYKVP